MPPRGRGGGALGLVLPLLAGLLLAFSFGPGLPASRPPPALPRALLGESLVSSAVQSLITGAPPEGGRPVACEAQGPLAFQCALPAAPRTGPRPLWQNLTASLSGAPSARSGAAAVYDAADGYVLLFGGSGSSSTSFDSDTWTFHAGTWTELTGLSTAPSARTAASLAYDAADHEVILFGGSYATSTTVTTYDDTWAFKGGAWSQLTIAGTSPSDRGSAAMAYDPAEGYVLLFGGETASLVGLSLTTEVFHDTWSFQGTTWTNLTSSVGTPPTSRAVAGMAYDPATAEMVLYGGLWDYVSGSTVVPHLDADTWTYAGGRWTNDSAAAGPGPLAAPGLVYDARLGELLLFGGCDATDASGDCSYTNVTWAFGSGGWTNESSLLSAAPSPRDSVVLVNDTADDDLLLFGGSCGSGCVQGDTWTGGSTDFHGPYTVDVTLDPVGCSLELNGTAGVVAGARTYAPGSYAAVAPACEGWTFSAWSASAGVSLTSPTLNSTTFLVASNGTLQASYAPATKVRITVQIVPLTCGPVDLNRTGEDSGQTVSLVPWGYALSAPACSQWEFQQWNVTAGLSVGFPSSPTATVQANVTGTLTAWYVWRGSGPPLYLVSFAVSPSTCGPIVVNGIDEGNGASSDLPAGNYSVQVGSCPGETFQQWNITGELTMASPTSPATQEALLTGEANLTAWFLATVSLPRYQVTVDVAPASCGPLTFNGSSAPSASTFTVVAATYVASAPTCAGHLFVRWSSTALEDLTTTLDVNTQVTVRGNGWLNATYEPTYSVEFAAEPASCPMRLNGSSVAPPLAKEFVPGAVVGVEGATCTGYSGPTLATTGGLSVAGSGSDAWSVRVAGNGTVYLNYTQTPATGGGTGSNTTAGLPWLTLLGVAVVLVVIATVVIVAVRHRRASSRGRPPPEDVAGYYGPPGPEYYPPGRG